MSIKETMLDTQSPKSKRYYTAMLKLLDSPNRELFDKSDRLVEAAGIAAGQTVLEIGCGSGYFTLPASKQLGENGTLYSTDIHDIAIEETQKKVDSHHLRNVNVKMDNALHSTFDTILLYGVVPAPVIPMQDLSREMHRLLKPGGICAIWTKAPFWSPKAMMKKAGFSLLKKQDGVFRYQKNYPYYNFSY